MTLGIGIVVLDRTGNVKHYELAPSSAQPTTLYSGDFGVGGQSSRTRYASRESSNDLSASIHGEQEDFTETTFFLL